MKLILRKNLTVIALLFCVFMQSFAGNTITIKSDACNFSMKIPEGWDTIPSDSLQRTLGRNNVLLGLYPQKQKHFFSDSYILIANVPSTKSLCNITFDRIVKELKEEISKVKLSNVDVLRITSTDVVGEHIGEHYTLNNSSLIENDTLQLAMYQTMILTRFGFLSVVLYNINTDSCKNKSKVKEIEKNIKIDSDFCYKEPEDKSMYTIVNIILSVVIGIVVYLCVSFWDKQKEIKCKK